MKNKIYGLLFIITLGILLSAKTAFANPTESLGVIDQIAAALNSHDAAALAASFDSNIEITLLDKESNYSKAQAQIVVKDFFAKCGASGFKLNHQGTSPDGSSYGIGNLTTSTGVIRVYYYMKSKGGVMVIQELRFEK